ncbi:MAG: septum formation initiator family protein [Calditrichaeota bacterium]|nr:MAG: septum formation initiator family protein [Calditrichota bacterium]
MAQQKKKKKASGSSRRKKKSRAQSPSRIWWIVGIIGVILIVSFFTGKKSLFTLYDLYQQRNHLLEEKKQLQQENEALLQEIDRLKKDIKYIEKVARENYNLKRDEEEVYQVAPQ